jgi:hypothetical protein
MKPASLILRTILAWFALVAARVIAGIAIPISFPGANHALAWILLTDFITVAILAYVALRADLRGWKLGAVLAAIPCVIAAANTIEGAIFLGNSGLPWTRILTMTLLTYLLVVPVWALLFGRRPPVEAQFDPLADKTLLEKLWRFALCDLSYLVLYYTAGAIIFPYVRDFYATQTIPPLPKIVALQLLIRGPMFIALCLLLVRLLRLPRLTGAVVTGVFFTILTGVLPLLIPNPVFPDAVRWVHMAEITSSNFVFAFIVAWLWTGASSIHAMTLPRAA